MSDFFTLLALLFSVGTFGIARRRYLDSKTPTGSGTPNYIAGRVAQGGNISEIERGILLGTQSQFGNTWNFAPVGVTEAPPSGLFDGTPNPNIPGMVWSNAVQGWIPEI